MDATWEKVMQVMTPGNLEYAGDPDISDIASCLGIGTQYKVCYLVDSGCSYISKYIRIISNNSSPFFRNTPPDCKE